MSDNVVIMDGPYKMVADRDTMIHRDGDQIVITSKRYADGKLAETTERRVLDQFNMAMDNDGFVPTIDQSAPYFIDGLHGSAAGYKKAVTYVTRNLFRKEYQAENTRQRMRSYRRKL